MPTLRNASGQEFDVSDVDAVKMSSADPSLTIVGDVRTSPEESGAAPVSQAGGIVSTQVGHAPATAAEQGAYSKREYLKGKTSVVGTTLRGVGSGLSVGLSDKLFDPETIEADEAIHGTLRTGATIAGALLPAAFGDEAGLAGLGGKTATVAEDALSAERLAGNVSSKFLYGGEVAGDAHGVERGLANGRRALDAAAAGSDAAKVAPDIAGLDLKGLSAAHDAEVESLVQAQRADRASAVAATGEYRQALKDANPWLVIDEGEDAARLNKGNRAIRAALDDTEGLAKNPSSLLKPLRQQEKSLQAAIDDRAAIAKRFTATNEKLASGLEEELATLPEAATHVEVTGKLAKRYGQYADVKVGKAGVSIARDDAAGFLDAMRGGQVQGEGEAALGKLPQLLEQNRSLQAKIEESLTAKADLMSDRLAAIKDAKTALQMPAAPKSLPQQLLEGTVFGHATALASPLGPLAPVIGAKASKIISDLVFGKAGKSIAAAGERSRAAVEGFLGRATASPLVPVLATSALARVAYAPRREGAPEAPAGKQSLPALYHARSEEIRSQTAYDATGTPRIRPEARQALADQLRALNVIAPVLADHLESIGVRKIEYLASMLPRRPDMGNGVQIGPDKWQPSDLEMRSFARRVAAAEDPGGVEDRLAHGRVSVEDVETYRAVYPERFAALQRDIVEQLPGLSKTLPYSKRVAFSMFSGVPVDPSMDPRILSMLQANFANEPGSQGGTQAPMPTPNHGAFGSIRKSLESPTPSQLRSQG